MENPLLILIPVSGLLVLAYFSKDLIASFPKDLTVYEILYRLLKKFINEWLNIKGTTGVIEFNTLCILLLIILFTVFQLEKFILSQVFLSVLVALISLIPLFSLLVRRLHDSNLSGWVLLIFPSIPIIYKLLFSTYSYYPISYAFVFFYFYLFLFRGTAYENNKYK